jgi:mRNA interferase MazF
MRISAGIRASSAVDAVSPQRWHVYVADLEPRIGTKPGKQRPCLAIQPTEFAEAGLDSTVVLPLTTDIVRADAFPLRVRVPKGTCGLLRDSDVLIDQILAWENSLFRKDLGELPEALQEDVRAALKEFLDLS